MTRLRDRFPPPWMVLPFRSGYIVMDSREVELVRIYAYREPPPSRHSRIHPQLSFAEARALARAICKIAQLEP
jgi:hypothetical protein